jgi:DNA-binding NarL/FixJ family response regulator
MLATDHLKKKPHVLIADDECIVAAGIRKLIEPECEVVGIVADGCAVLEEAQKRRPDVILMELTLPLVNGMDAIRQLTGLAPDSKVVVLTRRTSSVLATEVFRIGVSGYLLKRSPPAELSRAIWAVLKGQRYVTSLITPDVPAAGAGGSPRMLNIRPLPTLTMRQREVLQLIGEGRGTKEIASLLNIAVKTVEFHKFRIMEELNLHSTVELVKRAIAEGLVSL